MMTQRQICGVDEAVKILQEVAITPMATEVHFKYTAIADTLPVVEYYVKRLCCKGERKEVKE